MAVRVVRRQVSEHHDGRFRDGSIPSMQRLNLRSSSSSLLPCSRRLPCFLTSCFSRHREETVPLLFGEGNLNLQDPEQPPESSASSSYGSFLTKNKKPLQQPPSTADDDDEEEHPAPPPTTAEASRQVLSGDAKRKAIPATPETTKSDKTKKKKGVVVGTKVLTPRSAAALRAKPHVPPQNPCLWLFHLLQGIGVVAALMLWTTQIIPLVLAHGQVLAQIGWASVFLKVYISAFCATFVAVEADLPIPFLLNSNLLQRYFSRGFLYSFLGLICVQEAYSERVRDVVRGSSSKAVPALEVGWASIFMQLSSWLMLGVGTTYMLLGLCCLKRVRDRMKEQEQREWQEYRQALKEWKDLYQ